MEKKKTSPGRNGGTLQHAGRPVGVPNKVAMQVKEMIAGCFEKIGGIEEFATWARENRTEFYKIYSKLIPQEAKGSGDDKGGVVIQIVQFNNKRDMKEIEHV